MGPGLPQQDQVINEEDNNPGFFTTFISICSSICSCSCLYPEIETELDIANQPSVGDVPNNPDSGTTESYLTDQFPELNNEVFQTHLNTMLGVNNVW